MWVLLVKLAQPTRFRPPEDLCAARHTTTCQRDTVQSNALVTAAIVSSYKDEARCVFGRATREPYGMFVDLWQASKWQASKRSSE